MSLSIKEIVSKNMSDHSSVLAKKANWMEMDFLDKKMLNYTRPHSEGFYNPLGLDSFLYHFKKIEWFNFFPTLLVKDGLLSILHFFWRFQAPGKIKTRLILPKEAAVLVPTAWQDQCLFYEIGRHPVEEIKCNKLFLTTLVTPELYTKETLREKLAMAKNSSLPIAGLFFRHEPLGEEAVDTNENWDFKFFSELTALLDGEFELCDWKSVRGSDLSHASFLELNDNSYWYNDSTVAHSFLSQGAVPLGTIYPIMEFSEDECLRISRYHFYKFSELTKEQRDTGANCWKEISSLPHHIFAGECSLDRKVQDYKKIFLCTPEFKSMALDMVKKFT